MSGQILRLDIYSSEARQRIQAAQSLADARRHDSVEPVHLLYSLLDASPSASELVKQSSVDPIDALVLLESKLRMLPPLKGKAAFFGTGILDVMARAESEASKERKLVGVSHLLVSINQATTGDAVNILREVGLRGAALQSAIKNAPQEKVGANLPTVSDSEALTTYCVDLTAAAARGDFDPTVGRDAELKRMVQVLARRFENNPLIVGETGIGKSTLVRTLASRIASGDVPSFLLRKRVLQLDVGSLVAGATLRGQLEERTRGVLGAIREAAGEIILFLPSLATLMSDTGRGIGDLVNAALSRGELRAIAVATPDVLRKNDSGDALLSRFVTIPMEPPTPQDTVAILRGVVAKYEAAHAVRIADPALVSAVQLARRYVPFAHLPKAALDLIDEAAATVRVAAESKPDDLEALYRRREGIAIQQASMEDDTDVESVATLAELAKEAEEIGPRILEREKLWQEKQASAPTRPVVEPEDVAGVVASWTGTPVSKMLEEETVKLLRMEDSLKTRVVGQDHAVAAIAKAVRRGRVGLRDAKKPIGSFLFLGPTGVGKTELAKALAEFLFDDEHALTRLDMSEFMEKHNVARLLGAPPGYKDSDEGGFLTEAVRNKPYSVVLFDEMEKAHPDVFNVCLQVLDDGRLTDSRGRPAFFGDTVIIMTSNIGSHLILDHEGSDEELKAKIEAELHSFYRPEFLNRIDDVIIFNALTKENLRGIAEIQLKSLGKLLTTRRIRLDLTEEAKVQIVEMGYEPAFGARPLKRVILKNLQDPMAQSLLEGGYQAGDTVKVGWSGDKFTFEKVTAG